ncbi:dnaJ homolog subfamily C member 21 [Neocloeon triangulifer]|uniref:dnaJ homolog subfamily C member 21 n=1 Tax=Neocloeon triangulifer TaxID=2078957 RepID=UPI00286F7F99|nr:dnaJ homolog subfamily C member 21 [Neocloeon triangulifer]
MSAVKCHYEVLEVSRDASDDELKKSYRKLALKWHPDKNLSNPEEAKSQFQLIQQAFEVLSDPQERAWYDEHREAILKGGIGGDYEDDSFDVFPFFTSSCYKGFGDDEKGFYAVYREVFNKIAAEEIDLYREEESDSEFEIPGFGTSTSSYEDVVHDFYAFWQSFSTKKSYAWMDEYDTRQAENRRIVRAMDKENKKVREKARKARNEQIRTLVAFVRKRDKRIELHKQKLAEKAKENALKVENNRKKQLAERKKLFEEANSSKHLNMDDMEGVLKEIEHNLTAEFGKDEETTEDEEEPSGMFCVACNKSFKTDKAFANHENSKKHKENVALLKVTMQEEEVEFQSEEVKESDATADDDEDLVEVGYEILQEEDDAEEVQEEAAAAPSSKKKKNKKKQTARVRLDSSDVVAEDLEEIGISKKQRRKKDAQAKQSKPPVESDGAEANGEVASANIPVDEDEEQPEKVPPPKLKGKKAKLAKKAERGEKIACEESMEVDTDLTCLTCKSTFPTRNKLFDHFKRTGHAAPITDLPSASKSEKKKRR